VFAQDKVQERIIKATTVVKNFGTMEESIPSQLMEKAEGIIVIPGLINGGFMVGGKRGRGMAMVKNDDGTWSDPVFVTLTGGSFGLQIGVQSVDLVMVFLNKSTLLNIGTGEFTLGGDVSVAAGPLGRSSTATTDTKLEAEVYSYSRSKGIFAGISLSGAQLDVDKIANAGFYKKEVSAADIFDDVTSKNTNVLELKEAIGDL
jgi:lipid-binding SYLF domain-containing protein